MISRLLDFVNEEKHCTEGYMKEEERSSIQALA